MMKFLTMFLLAIGVFFAILLLPLWVAILRVFKPRKRFLIASVIGGLLTWYETRDYRMARGWHPCENPRCNAPIPNSSRARFCSSLCRRTSRMLQEEFHSSQGEVIPF